MTKDGDQQSQVRERPTWWLYLIPVGVLVVTVITWWALGLRPETWASGFGDAPVSFTFTDTDLNEALAVIRPGVPVRFDGAATGFVVTLKVTGLKEHVAMHWLGSLIDQHITLTDGVIVIQDISWLERSHRAAAYWMRTTFGVQLWPHR